MPDKKYGIIKKIMENDMHLELTSSTRNDPFGIEYEVGVRYEPADYQLPQHETSVKLEKYLTEEGRSDRRRKNYAHKFLLKNITRIDNNGEEGLEDIAVQESEGMHLTGLEHYDISGSGCGDVPLPGHLRRKAANGETVTYAKGLHEILN